MLVQLQLLLFSCADAGDKLLSAKNPKCTPGLVQAVQDTLGRGNTIRGVAIASVQRITRYALHFTEFVRYAQKDRVEPMQVEAIKEVGIPGTREDGRQIAGGGGEDRSRGKREGERARDKDRHEDWV